ncbi:MAG TPA: hypothetical protein VI854_09540, partial [Acidimicrobiia bacterium]|nr:hypothetical protein [Acidimicrobiia bacterium]
MAIAHIVVDGSNLATEGRSIPSLAQLQEAVAALRAEQAEALITVVVDASFGRRIDSSERALHEKLELAGEIVSPPAGAIGRGDRFLLQIADRTGATVVSNDSFQELHGEFGWLFDPGRLLGGKPVPGVGWIFSLRSPVRSPASRGGRGRLKQAQVVRRAIAEATQEALAPAPPIRAVTGTLNAPGPFLEFVAHHPPGSHVDGHVDRLLPQGAFVVAEGLLCFVPRGALGSPPPRRPEDALHDGEDHDFVVQAVDPARRGVELALPGQEHPAG